MEVLGVLFLLFIVYCIISAAVLSIREKIIYKKACKEYETVLKLAYGNLQNFDERPIDEFIEEVNSNITPQLPEKERIKYKNIIDIVSGVGKKYFIGRKDEPI